MVGGRWLIKTSMETEIARRRALDRVRERGSSRKIKAAVMKRRMTGTERSAARGMEVTQKMQRVVALWAMSTVMAR